MVPYPQNDAPEIASLRIDGRAGRSIRGESPIRAKSARFSLNLSVLTTCKLQMRLDMIMHRIGSKSGISPASELMELPYGGLS